MYVLASTANVLLSIPQYLALNTALELSVHQLGVTGSLTAQYGSSVGLALDFLRTGLVFQGIMAVLVLGLAGSAGARKSWRWLYAISSVLVSAYVAYHLGGRFLNALSWIGFLQSSGVDSSLVYGDLFWFGLGTTICYVLVVLVLRRSYTKLSIERQNILAL